jgi:CheY-like chemotaxis protein
MNAALPTTPILPSRASLAERSLRILIADDNCDSADSLALLLKMGGHEVWTVYDGPTALKTAAQCQPHVVLSDLGMPGMNGYEIARRLREQEASRECVLVAVTGYAQSDNGTRIQDAGFDHHMVKPVEFAALQLLLDSVPGRRPSQPLVG